MDLSSKQDAFQTLPGGSASSDSENARTLHRGFRPSHISGRPWRIGYSNLAINVDGRDYDQPRRIAEVIDGLEATLGQLLFPSQLKGCSFRTVPFEDSQLTPIE